VPILAGITGYVINWTGVWMLYRPVEFHGIPIPGLKRIAPRLPRKIRELPGVMRGGLGWQGIIPSRAAKMGTIAVDKQISSVGTPAELYEKFGPDAITEHIVQSSQDEIRDVVERVLEREHPELWRDLPPRVRETLHARVREEMPGVADEVTEAIRQNIDELLDVEMMVIRRLEDRRELTNKLFHEVGAKEFRFIIRFGFVFAFVASLPVIPLLILIPEWWVLPLAEGVIGYLTNWLGILLIYEPEEPKKIGPFTLQGLFAKRQHDAAKAYGEVISEEIITLRNIAEALLNGPSGDRTREVVERAVRPAVDRAVGAARPAVVAAIGSDEYEAVRESLAAEAVDPTIEPLKDPDFSRRRSEAIRRLFTDRMRDMKPGEFIESLRSATRQDEWILVAHGFLFGIAGGLLHYAIFGV
jgi:uncharacterized membrane protein YheB (UPF0754 family)